MDRFASPYNSGFLGALPTPWTRQIGLDLNNHKVGETASVAQTLIADHAVFKGYARFLRNQKTQAYTIDQVLCDLSGDDMDKAELLAQYSRFDEEWWSLVQTGLSSSFDEYSTQLVNKALKVADSRTVSKDTMRGLLAHLFAYWTLSDSSHYHKAKSGGGAEKAKQYLHTRMCTHMPTLTHAWYRYLLQPHSAQVISIFRLLGMDKRDTSAGSWSVLGFFKAAGQAIGIVREDDTPIAENHLVQIKTGEVKHCCASCCTDVQIAALLHCCTHCCFVTGQVSYFGYDRCCARSPWLRCGLCFVQRVSQHS